MFPFSVTSCSSLTTLIEPLSGETARATATSGSLILIEPALDSLEACRSIVLVPSSNPNVPVFPSDFLPIVTVVPSEDTVAKPSPVNLLAVIESATFSISKPADNSSPFEVASTLFPSISNNNEPVPLIASPSTLMVFAP